MDIPTNADVDRLLEARDGPCVSLFMPAHRRGAETQQDPVRLKNLLESANARLTGLGLRAPDARSLLGPARRLLDDGEFWRHQGDGLAVFLAPHWSHHLRLPYGVPELAVVGERFHVRPLFGGLWPEQPFYLLALSQGQNRFFEGSRYAIEQRDVPGAPQGIEDWLQYIDAERQLQAKVGPRRDVARAAIFHGHGSGGETEEERVVEYLRQLDAKVTAALRDGHRPLILAGVEYVRARYREVTRYGHVLVEGVDGNPDGLTEDELHASAWPLAERVALELQRKDLERFAEAAAKGRAVAGVRDVLGAVVQGRVEVLFTARDELRWGRFSPESGEVEEHPAPEPGDEELVDRAAVETYRTAGAIYALPVEEMPAGQAVAALTRY